MSDRLTSKKTGPPVGTGPDGRIEISDIRTKLQEIQGDTSETAERARPAATVAAAVGAVVVLGGAFWLGRRRGRRKSTWVEIRRL